jgi:two-component system, OmpR family, sensor histidine kinase KdpD
MAVEPRRKTPEEFLRECQAEEPRAPKGHLKIFLGYASGVGKSFRMLDEARRRRERGQDIVVGAIQPKVPAEVEAVLRKIEVIALKQTAGGFAIDVDAIVKRKPTVCVIDGLAYDNPPGARNATRWQDVAELVAAGIKVIGSINIQYVDEMRAQTEAITGKHVLETVPVAFIKSADEIEIVDAPPETTVDRSPAEMEEMREREQRMSKLRELALVLAADVVDRQLNSYLEEHGIRQRFGTHERILVCVTPRGNVQAMIQTAIRTAARFHGEVLAAYVKQPGLSDQDREALDARLAVARDAGAQIEILEGGDPGEMLLEFARSRGVTQLFVGHSRRTGLARLRGSPLDNLIWEGHGMDVHVFPQ